MDNFEEKSKYTQPQSDTNNSNDDVVADKSAISDVIKNRPVNAWVNTKPSMRESISEILDRSSTDDIDSVIKVFDDNDYLSIDSGNENAGREQRPAAVQPREQRPAAAQQQRDQRGSSSNGSGSSRSYSDQRGGSSNGSSSSSRSYSEQRGGSSNGSGSSRSYSDQRSGSPNGSGSSRSYSDQRGGSSNGSGGSRSYSDQRSGSPNGSGGSRSYSDQRGGKAVSYFTDLERRAVTNKLAYDNELSTRVAALAGRHSYYVGKYSFVAGRAIVRGTFGFSKHTANLIADKAKGNITAKEAAVSALSRGKKSISDSGVSIRKIIKKQTLEGVKNFRGSEDIGIQAIVKVNYVYLRTRQVIQASKAKKNVKTIKGTTKVTNKVMQQAVRASRSIAAATKRILTNPIVVKGSLAALGILLLAAIVMAAITAVSALIPSISLKSDAEELTKTYKYITELDSRFTEKINNIPNDADEIHYYVNGVETYGDTMFIMTNADSILAYFDIKYDGYAFDKLIYGIFGGTNIKSELEALHDALYTIETKKWEESIEGTDESKWHLDVNIKMTDFDTYILMHESDMLSEEQKERFKILNDIGVYTAKKELSNPFGEDNYFISSRFGWNVDTISGNLVEHDGIDIPKPEGTKVTNMMYGTVVTTAFDNERGNYVIVEHNDHQVIYQHLKDVSVTAGQIITRSDTIGTVGSTGNSSFPHLHIEYWKNNFALCPSIFIDGVATISGIQPSFPGVGGTGGGGDILELAASQIGNVGGRTYWEYYGFSHPTAWCAIFVSWCAEMTGNINTTIPKFFLCTNGVDWFQKKGLFQHRSSGYIPRSGDVIFFDFSSRNGSGMNAYGYGADHVGYVESCDGTTVYTIEGNTSNSVARRRYNINKASIVGYGTPVYSSRQEGE